MPQEDIEFVRPLQPADSPASTPEPTPAHQREAADRSVFLGQASGQRAPRRSLPQEPAPMVAHSCNDCRHVKRSTLGAQFNECQAFCSFCSTVRGRHHLQCPGFSARPVPLPGQKAQNLSPYAVGALLVVVLGALIFISRAF